MTIRSGRLAGMAVAGVLASVALSACSGSPSSSRAARAGSTNTTSLAPMPPRIGPPTTSTGQSGTSTTTTKVPPGPTTTAAGATPGARCLPGQLHATAGLGQGAAGHILATVVLHNSPATACTLDGYPGLQMLDAHGHPLPTVVARGAAMGLPAVPPRLVTLPRGGSASFSLAYEDVPVGNEGPCPTSARLEVTPPNDFGHLVISDALTPCRGGTITVSPVVAGRAGSTAGNTGSGQGGDAA